MDTLMRKLPDGTRVVAVKPDALVENLADWRNDHEGGCGRDKPRVFLLRDGHYKQIYLLYRHVVTPVAFTAIGAGTYHVYRDETLWIEVIKAQVIDALDLETLAGDLLAAPTPAGDESLCNVEPVELHIVGYDTVAFELTQAGRELAATLKFRRQPTMYQLTDKARALINGSAGVS